MDITWGKPKLEFGKHGTGGTVTTWTEMPIQKEDTVQLSTEKGEVKELFGEGHELVARKVSASTYKLEAEVFVDKGTQRPIPDVDGVIDGKYGVRLSPEDTTLTGFQFPAATVEVEETWSSAEGTKLKYTFTAVKPTTGNMMQAYKASTGGGS